MFHEFNDKEILKLALTHKSFDKDNNYEKLELLGDSLVEVFIELFLFEILSPYLYVNDNIEININYTNSLSKKAQKFNNKEITKIKSLLCSNNFMCKIALYLTLPYFLKLNKSTINQKIFNNFVDENNIKSILLRKLNEYDHSDSVNPKFIADLFEALIGAIYIDKGLKECFNILNKIYKPFICYCITYFEELKYSIVDEFTEYMRQEYKISPTYSKSNNDKKGQIIIHCLVNEGIFSEGSGKDLNEAKLKATENAYKKIKEAERKYEIVDVNKMLIKNA